MRRSANSGFTMIELIMVITILGILAAIAMPKFIDLKSDSQSAAFEGVAGAISSANSINYTSWIASGGTKGFRTFGLGCGAVAAGILQGGLPSGYTFLKGANQALSGGMGAEDQCTLTLTANPSLTRNITINITN